MLREGSLLAKVRHRNVVVVHGVERSDGFVGLWMEFINGRTMEDELRARGPLSAEEATPIGVDLCQALAAVHGRGLVHRDVKAQNVMREEGGRTVLMDFGAGTELATGLRKPLDMAGTPLYLAPELFDGQPATRASDIYSLGVLLYRMVTREYPVEGADRSQIERAHRDGRVKRLRDVRPDLPSEFIQTVERALSPDPVGTTADGRRARGRPDQQAQPHAGVVDVVPARGGRRRGRPPRGDSGRRCSCPTMARTRHHQSMGRVRPSRRTPALAPAAAVDPSYLVRARMFRTRNGVETLADPRHQLAGGRPAVDADRVIDRGLRLRAQCRRCGQDRTACSRCPTINRTIPSRAAKVHRLPGEWTWTGSSRAKAGANIS